ncbi:hypothetical protein ACFSKW_35345 [Nonomuraea mangrovi]|uniref:Uncharacterized protein n=1 Tax=Nonomuraea mangrovi TaxID=2316207 RepID=A0ABW4T5V7_9ACTN
MTEVVAADAHLPNHAGHRVIALIVGTLSGGLLPHGPRANQIPALDDPGVVSHDLSNRLTSPSARQTRAASRSVHEELAARWG